MNKNLILVTMLSVGTALTTMGRVKPVAASLTAPVTYDYSYTWNAADSEQYLNVNGVDSIPLYTRTADGVYYDYVSTFTVIEGLTVTMDFQRSNTTWQASGISYKPDENRIGSDATINATNKFYLKFDNQTNNDFYISFDNSSSPNVTNHRISYNGKVSVFAYGPTEFQPVNLPSYSYVEIYILNTSAAKYFDAWYLEDLGISEAYQQGYDANRTGILTDYLGTEAQQIGWILLGIAAIVFAFKGGK
jgi:hypothetical protein